MENNYPCLNCILSIVDIGGTYDGELANEYCFTLFNTVVSISADDIKYVYCHQLTDIIHIGVETGSASLTCMTH